MDFQVINTEQAARMPGRRGVVYELDRPPYTRFRWDGNQMVDQAAVAVDSYYDGCFYDAKPGDLFAAVAAARLGAKVIVVASGEHIGGMLTGGLSATDIALSGYSGQVVGMAYKFYGEVAAEVGMRQEVFLRNGYAAPPRVVERVLRRWMASAGVRVVTNAPISSVVKPADIITSIVAGPYVIRARNYVDGSYEGDLAAAANCTMATGREANAKYGEFVNGVRDTAASPQLDPGVSPYVVVNDPQSGLLPGLQYGAAGVQGAASNDIMAFTYRLTLCQAADAAGTYAKLAMPEPDVYDPKMYEALGRHIEIKAAAAPAEWLTVKGTERSSDRALIVPLVGTTKVDFNSGSWAIGTNYVSPLCAEYATASHERRAEIRMLVKRWVLGWFKFLRTDPRVPAAMRADAALWGVPSDELNFVQLYVRAGRRLVGDFILTEAHCRNAQVFTDGVAVIYYELDSHVCRRFVENGVIYNEGFLSQACYTNGNPLPFRVMKPKVAECRNLLVTFAVSSTYAAFCSVRMEPISMALGEAAGIAVWLAAQRGIYVSDVVVSEVQFIQNRFRFNAPGGAVLAQDGAAPFNQGTATKVAGSGAWNVGTAVIVGHPAHTVNAAADAYIDFFPKLEESGVYDLFAFYVVKTDTARSSATPVEIYNANGQINLTLNQNSVSGATASTSGEGGNGVYLNRGTWLAGNPSTNKVRVKGAVGGAVIAMLMWLPVKQP